MKTTTCRRCKATKPVDCFTRHKQSKDGFDKVCRACTQTSHRAWRTGFGRERFTPEQTV